MKKTGLLVLYLFGVVFSYAQSGSSIIQEALLKTSAWKDVANLNYTSLQISYNKWQSYDFYKPGGNKNVLQFSYDLLNGQYFYTIDSYYGGGYHFSYANIGVDSLRYSFDQKKNRDGKKASKQGKAQFIAGASLLHQFIPYYLLKSLTTKNDSLYVLKDANFDIVRRNLKQGGYEAYYFNTERQLIKQVVVQGAQQSERMFKKYSNAGSLNYACIIDTYVNGTLLTRDSIYNITTEPLQKSKLQLSSEYKLDTATLAPQVSTIGDRVHLIENVPGGRNMMFVEMDDGIFVTEAPLSIDVSKAMIDLIHKKIPGKQIKYVHLSHFHNDHTNGIRAFAAEGATIVGTEYTLGVIRTILDDTTGKLKLNNSADFLSLSDFNAKVGKETIRLFELKNNHAKGMSFVYLPAQKIIYEGDLYTLPKDETITPAIEITRQFADYLGKKKINPSRIIGHHGSSNITLEILKTAVQIKNK